MADSYRDIAALPYAQRRLLTVADHWIVRMDRLWDEHGISKPASDNLAAEYMREQRAKHGVGKLTSFMALLGINRTASQARKMHAVGVLPVTVEESRLLQFPPNHPLVGVVYAAHPRRSQFYLPLAEFHTRIFEDKFSEILRVLSALGARRIAVTASEGWGREVAVDLSANFPGATALAVKREAGVGQQGLLYLADLPGNVGRSLPGDLTWYWTEPTWQELARQRLEHSLREFRLLFQYRDDYGVTQRLAAGVQGVGLGAGGTFRQHVNTTWILAGEFSPP
jgi:hypothetical protein